MQDFSRSFPEGDDEPEAPVREHAFGSLSKIKVNRQAARRLNQRGEDRQPGGSRQADLAFRGGKHPVHVVNRSRGGAMIESDLEPFIGEPLEIRFYAEAAIQCVARWVRDGRIGLEFGSHSLLVGEASREQLVVGIGEASELALEEGHEPSAREPRQAVIRTGVLQSGNKSIPVRLCNISTGGVMLECEQYVAPGSAVRLDMAGGMTVTAQVRWNKGKKAGLSFDAQVNPKHLGSLAAPVPKVIKPSYLDSEFDLNSPWAARFERLTAESLTSGSDD